MAGQKDPHVLLELLARREMQRRDLINEAHDALDMALHGNPTPGELRNTIARAVLALEDALTVPLVRSEPNSD